MKYSRAFILFLFLIASFLSAAAQTDDDPVTVDTSLVRLNVGVADRKGRPVTDLTRENFTIFEDGVKQSIQRFEPVVAPFSVVMILDMSGSTLGFRETIRQSGGHRILR
jgi:Ca-activated chloride channel family protein